MIMMMVSGSWEDTHLVEHQQLQRFALFEH
jgi:hypothetical protein